MFRIIRRSLYWLFHSPRDFAITVLDNLAPWLPDKLFIKMHFRLSMGYPLNLKNPKTFNEKLQWLKFNDIHEEYTQMVDKLEAKKHVARIIGKEHIIPTIGIWNSVDEIDWASLPNQFVLKSTNDSGGVVICRDKSKFDIESAKAKLRTLGNRDYSLISKEYPYKNVPHRIIAEEYKEDESSFELKDYKFFCFNGDPKFFKVDFDRHTNHRANYYDKNWNFLPFYEKSYPHDKSKKLVIPYNFEEMIEIAKKLSENIPFVRIDLYNINGMVYFGEITFFPSSGLGIIEPTEWDKSLGDMLVLPTL